MNKTNLTYMHNAKVWQPIKPGKKTLNFVIAIRRNQYPHLYINDIYVTRFILDCEDGFYNAICSAKCGLCLMDELCDKVTGGCSKGCKTHYQPPLCQGNDEFIQKSIPKLTDTFFS